MRVRDRSLILLLSKSFNQAATIILSLILVRLVSKYTLGTYRQVMLIYMMLSTALSLQLHQSLYYFIPRYPLEARRKILGQSFALTLASSALIAALMYFGSDFLSRRFNNPGLAPLIRILALYPFFECTLLLIPDFMISIDRPVRAGLYSLLDSGGRILVVVILVGAEFSLEAALWGILFWGALLCLIGCADLVRFCPAGPWKIDTRLLAQQFQYCWPLLLTTLIGTFNLLLDKFLISLYFDPEVYAVYSCGAFQLPVISLVTATLGTAIMPNLVDLIQHKKQTEAVVLWQEAARKGSLILFPCFIFFLIVGYDLMVFLFTPEYAEAAWPFRIYLFSLPFRIIIYTSLLRAMGKTRPIAIGALLMLVSNLIFSVSLLHLGKGGFLSFVGPAVGTILSTWLNWIYLLYILKRVGKISLRTIMPWKELGAIFLTSCVCGIVIFMVPAQSMPLLAKLVIQAALFGSAYFLLNWITPVFKEDERKLLISGVNHLLFWRK